MTITIRDARRGDVDAIAGRLRREDEQEVLTAGHASGHAALLDSFDRSTMCFCVDIDGHTAAMWGIVPESYVGMSAVVWLLGTPEMARIKKTFVKLSRRFVRDFLTLYPVLYNVVDSRYGAAVRWLMAIGADFYGEPVKANGVEFLRFEFRRVS